VLGELEQSLLSIEQIRTDIRLFDGVTEKDIDQLTDFPYKVMLPSLCSSYFLICCDCHRDFVLVV